MAKKATNAEIEKRLTAIYQLIVEGYSFMDIIRYGKQEWGLSKSGTEKYLRVVTKRISKECSENLEEMRSEANARYKQLYKKSYQKGWYKVCAYIQSRMDKINGLQVERVIHSLGNDKEREEVINAFDKLRQKYNNGESS